MSNAILILSKRTLNPFGVPTCSAKGHTASLSGSVEAVAEDRPMRYKWK